MENVSASIEQMSAQVEEMSASAAEHDDIASSQQGAVERFILWTKKENRNGWINRLKAVILER